MQTPAFRKATAWRYTELLAPLITLMLPGTPPPQCMNPAAATQTDKRLVGDGGSGGGFDCANDRLDLARRWREEARNQSISTPTESTMARIGRFWSLAGMRVTACLRASCQAGDLSIAIASHCSGEPRRDPKSIPSEIIFYVGSIISLPQ